MLNAFESEARRCVFNSPDCVNGNCLGDRDNDNNQSYRPSDAPNDVELFFGQRQQLCRQEKVENGTSDNDKHMCDKPELIGGFRFDFCGRLLSTCEDELLAYIRALTKFFRRFRHLLTDSRLAAKPIAESG